MKKQLLFILIAIFISLQGYSQITFERGYFIDNSDQRIDCHIKNIDWKNNPTEFEYRLLQQDQVKKATIESVKEFGIDNGSKYSREIVEMDRSKDDFDNLDFSRNPTFKEEEVFLKILVVGQANLYSYEDGNLTGYFYKWEDSKIQQLVHKFYRISHNRIGENTRFRQQLLNNVNCKSFPTDKVEKVEYEKNDLVDYFVEYHKCMDLEFSNFENKYKRDLVKFNIHINSSIYYRRSDGSAITSLELESRPSLALGVGYWNKDKYGLELRYQIGREVLSNFIILSSSYKSLSIIFGYPLFNKNSS